MSRTIPIGEITLDPRLQMRVKMSEEAIVEYVENLDKLPPPRVVDDGEKLWLIDWHRFSAYQKAGKTAVPCEVIKGTFTDALYLAAGANSDHGVRRTTDDKRKAVETLLSINGYADMSDRALADICKVSDHFVARVRATASARSSGKSDNSSSDNGRGRTGKDGKTRKPKHKPGEKAEPKLPICKRCKKQGLTSPRRNCPVCQDLGAKAKDRHKTAEEKAARKKAKEGLKLNMKEAGSIRLFFESYKAVDERNQRAVETVTKRAAELCDAINRLWESETAK